MSDREPETRHDEAPWWESGEAPEGFAIPKRRSRRILVIVAILMAGAAVDLIIWGIAAGASSTGAMPM